MTTTVVFVLCCNLLWIILHDSSGVHGLDDPNNTTLTPVNISKQFPVSVSTFEKPVSSIQRTEEQNSHFPKSRSRQKSTNSRTKTMSQLLKINAGYLPSGQIKENRVSPGKSQDSIRSPSMDRQGLSTLPSVLLSQNNKLYYSENSTEGNFVISLKGGKSGTSADRKSLPKILIPTRPALKRQPGQLPRVEDIQPTRFTHTVETVQVDATKKVDDGETINEEYKSYRNTRDSRRRLSTTNSVRSEATSLIDRVVTDRPHSSTLPSTSNTVSSEANDTTVSSEANESVWSQWGACSVSCGTGTQERSRTCGPNCQQVESMECYLDSCHGIMRGLNFSDLNVQNEFHINDSSFNQSGVPKQTFLDTEVDACAMWSSCKDEYLQRYMSHLSELANCPCYYPFNLEHNNNVWDHNRRRYYQWVEVNSTDEKLHVYRPKAYKCIRSLLFPGAATLAAQVCCYTDNLQLVTRGRNAGTPNLISPQISWELHYKIDILPWVICKGDWTRYNRVLPPNNMLGCAENPYEEQLMQEVQEARDY